MKMKILGAIGLTLLISGCAGKHAPMSKNVQRNLGSIDTSLIIKQSNLDITVTSTNGGQGGLLGVLIAAGIDSIRRSSAEKEAIPIVKSLQNYNFRKVMLRKMTASLAKVRTVKVKLPIKVDNIGSQLTSRVIYDRSMAKSVLLCHTGYRLESGNLIVTLYAKLYPKSTGLNQFRKKENSSNPLDEGNIIYNNRFSFVKQGISPQNIKQSLNEAAVSISTQLATDIGHGI